MGLFDPINLDGFATVKEAAQAAQVLLKLSDYAKVKALAMRHRSEGYVTVALKLERRCEEIYKSLPEWARW